RRGTKNLFKKMAILVVAALWTLGIQPLSGAAQPAIPSGPPGSSGSSRTSAIHTSRRRALIVRNASARRVRRRRRRVTRWSPWHVGSFGDPADGDDPDRKSTRLNSSHGSISYAVFCLKKKKNRKQA